MPNNTKSFPYDNPEREKRYEKERQEYEKKWERWSRGSGRTSDNFRRSDLFHDDGYGHERGDD